MRALNAEHRDLDEVTDVLAFPMDGVDELPPGLERQLGDVVICFAQADRQAGEAGVETARRGAHARRPRPPAPARPRPRGRRGRDARAAGRAHARCCPSCDAPGTLRHGPVTLCARSVAACNLRRAHPHPCRSAAACGHPAPPSSRARRGRWPRSISPTGARCSRSSAGRSGWPFPRARRRSSRPCSAACRSFARRHRPRAAAGSERSSRSRPRSERPQSRSPRASRARRRQQSPGRPRRWAPLARSSRWRPQCPRGRAEGARRTSGRAGRAAAGAASTTSRLRRRRLPLPWHRRRSIPRRRPCPSSRRHPRCDGRVPDWKR